MVQIVPALEQHWHDYACDLRGHGLSHCARSGYRLNDIALDTAAFVECCVGQPAVLVGYSLGAMADLVVAARWPQWVRAPVLEPPLIVRGHRTREIGWPYD